ncbi:MAG: ATP-binding protein [Nitritalea sp.]
MLSDSLIILFTFGYLALLFAIAWYTERSAEKGRRLGQNPYVYALSLAVYCTAWTYYGSVGQAATHGLQFLTTYIGPTLIAPLWWVVMRKIIRISKLQGISSIADFISSRYGKNATLGAIVAIFCLVGIIPYISLQVKAIANSFNILHISNQTEAVANTVFRDTAFYLSLGLAFFTILFGTRSIEANARHDGMVMTVAFESLFKLFAFLAAGVFVTYFIFDGFGSIFDAASRAGYEELFTLKGEHVNFEWFWLSILSMLAMLFLPRQFQLGVIENTDERHLDKAMWLFPLYLFLINVFVLPIALAGLTYFQGEAINADTFVLALPIATDQAWLAVIVYLGGFSAATSMIIISTIALSTMVSNNLVMPLLLVSSRMQNKYQNRLSALLLWSRRLSILAIILLAYMYYRIVVWDFSLVSIGLVSFVAIAQFAPAILGGIFWKGGARIGAITGISVGFVMWFYTLVLPTIVHGGFLSEQMLTEGPWGISFLKPYALFGFQDLDYVSHGLFFSLVPNILAYILLSIWTKQNSKEHNQALVFVDIFKYSETLDSSIVWKGKAYLPDLKALLENFLGVSETKKLLDRFFLTMGKPIHGDLYADPALVNYSERVLAGIIGAASARIMVASVVKEEEISLEEVLGILKETQELKSLNDELKVKSKQLKQATRELQSMNEALRTNDLLKDEFISTVTHEMKTPITSIRAFSEILLDDDLPEEEKKRFLGIIIQETSRMTRLIDQVLDLERFDSGRQELNLEKVSLSILLLEACDSMGQVFKERKLIFKINLDFEELFLLVDEDRIKQVILNLLSNAAKFAKSKVVLAAARDSHYLSVRVMDDGKGIPEEEIPYIFDKFFQAKNQTSKKPIGSGLGLAISKKIVEYHGGEIEIQRIDGLTCFHFTIPIQSETSKTKLSEKQTNYG